MGESSKGEVASDESTRRLSWRLLEENFRLGGATRRTKATQTCSAIMRNKNLQNATCVHGTILKHCDRHDLLCHPGLIILVLSASAPADAICATVGLIFSHMHHCIQAICTHCIHRHDCLEHQSNGKRTHSSDKCAHTSSGNRARTLGSGRRGGSSRLTRRRGRRVRVTRVSVLTLGSVGPFRLEATGRVGACGADGLV
jgi:hypothetical protein